jgi:hypothetical protein
MRMGGFWAVHRWRGKGVEESEVRICIIRRFEIGMEWDCKYYKGDLGVLGYGIDKENCVHIDLSSHNYSKVFHTNKLCSSFHLVYLFLIHDVGAEEVLLEFPCEK